LRSDSFAHSVAWSATWVLGLGCALNYLVLRIEIASEFGETFKFANSGATVSSANVALRAFASFVSRRAFELSSGVNVTVLLRAFELLSLVNLQNFEGRE